MLKERNNENKTKKENKEIKEVKAAPSLKITNQLVIKPLNFLKYLFGFMIVYSRAASGPERIVSVGNQIPKPEEYSTGDFIKASAGLLMGTLAALQYLYWCRDDAYHGIRYVLSWTPVLVWMERLDAHLNEKYPQYNTSKPVASSEPTEEIIVHAQRLTPTRVAPGTTSSLNSSETATPVVNSRSSTDSPELKDVTLEDVAQDLEAQGDLEKAGCYQRFTETLSSCASVIKAPFSSCYNFFASACAGSAPPDEDNGEIDYGPIGDPENSKCCC